MTVVSFPPVDSASFRRALGQYATGVAVITGRDGNGERFGLTVSSFNSVSLDPPLVLFSIDRAARSLPSLLASEGYAVNILCRHQDHLSNRFARYGADKWVSVEHALGHAQAPLLPDTLAHFECAHYAHYDGGDHVICVGRVLSFAWNEAERPLIFFRGAYRDLHLDAS
ncbi:MULTISPECIES: flavin reductase family protein [unclassified Chelatococcus]|uniref:flavin reductase family protein n=1 Tax=unclassified Chelatococcus TaxID=2638111 RepID=UPI001BD18BF6|nr:MULTISPECIES: flavin reductase family protein [unclassified Chelatococcus]MBS7701198.1 flavin reductase family protein [Chelatococcus sp. YT9]MBX3557329.1 flavin reductase family protein [Chelatococcus sp.]